MYVLGWQSNVPGLVLLLADIFFQNLHTSHLSFMTFSTLTRFPVSDVLKHITKLPPLCFTVGKVFFSLSLSKQSGFQWPKSCSCKDVLPVCIIFLQVVFSILQSGMKGSLLQKWNLSWSAILQSLPVQGSSASFESTTPDLAKSFTRVMAVVLWSLKASLPSFLSRVFKIFASSLCQPSSVLCGSLWISWWCFSLQFLTLGDAVITLWASILFLKSDFFCFRHDALSSDSSRFRRSFCTVSRLEDNPQF